MSDVDLHALIAKLDEVLDGRGWALKRVQGRIGLAWRIETRLADNKDIGVENISPEMAIRGALGHVLEHVQHKAGGKADEARAAREEVERLQRVIGRPNT